MLPFLDRKRQTTGIAVEYRKPDESATPSTEDDNGLSACASDLISAIHSKDAKSVAAALKSLFEIMESQETEESTPTEQDIA